MFLTQIVNGQVSELALCETCAREKGLFDPQSLTFAEKFFPEEFRNRVDKLVRELTQSESVAAAPATPMWKTSTKTRSSTILLSAATIMACSGV